MFSGWILEFFTVQPACIISFFLFFLQWAPCHAIVATPLLIAFELLLCIYLESLYGMSGSITMKFCSTRIDNSTFFILFFFLLICGYTWLCSEVTIKLSRTKNSFHYQIILLVYLYHECIKHCCFIRMVSNFYLTRTICFLQLMNTQP